MRAALLFRARCLLFRRRLAVHSTSRNTQQQHTLSQRPQNKPNHSCAFENNKTNNSQHKKATEHGDLKALLSRAQVLDELEATLPPWLERRWPHCWPAFVHVLRLDARSLEAPVDARAAWRRAGACGEGDEGGGGGQHDGGGGGHGGGSGGGELAGVKEELAALRRQVAALSELLHSAVPSLPASPSPARSEA